MKKRLSNNILQVCVSQNLICIKLKTLTLILENNDYDVLHHMTVLESSNQTLLGNCLKVIYLFLKPT